MSIENIINMNRSRIDKNFRKSIYSDFKAAIIWQNEQLENCSDVPLSYLAKNEIIRTCDIFVDCLLLDDRLIDEAIKHEIDHSIGHDLAMQSLGHCVGFWEQEDSENLNQLLTLLMVNKSIQPFELYLSSSVNELDFDWC
jgi:hypothetical protein